MMSSARRKKALCHVYKGEHKILDSDECRQKRLAFQSAIENGTLESFKATAITGESGKALQNKSLAGKSIRNRNSEYWSPPPDTGGFEKQMLQNVPTCRTSLSVPGNTSTNVSIDGGATGTEIGVSSHH